LKYPCTNVHTTLAISGGAGDGDPYGSNDIRVVDVSEAMEAPDSSHIEIRASCQKRWQDQQPNWSASALMQTAWATDRSSWKPLC